jgi:hypothetical protein
MLRRAAVVVTDRRAMESVARNAWRHVDELRGSHAHLADEELANLAVSRVLAAAKAYPPASAITVRIEPSAFETRTETGIWTEEAMAIVLRWNNRADFAIELQRVTGAVSIVDRSEERTFTLDAPSRFEIGPRCDHRLSLVAVLDRKVPPPRYSQAAVSGEVSVNALVMGPWPQGSHQVQCFQTGRAWFAVSTALVVTGGG